MPTLPTSDRNLVQGLSDFWVSWFRDTAFTETYFQAGQLLLGQLYLDLCEAVLGSSLDHAPVFSKAYYQYLPVREDQVVFVEGASPADDRHVYTPPVVLAGADLLMNRVVAPTRTFDLHRDFDVGDGKVRFAVDPFDEDGAGNALANVPQRVVQVVAAVAAQNLRGATWKAAGVRAGDSLWFRVGTATTPRVSPIQALDGARLMLSTRFAEYAADLRGRSFELVVLRTPYDAHRVGVAAPGQATAYEAFAGTLTVGAKTLTVTTPPADVALATGRYVWIDDAGEPRNSGYARVTGVAGPVVTVDRAENFRVSATAATLYVVDHGLAANAVPAFPLPDTWLDANSVGVTARRAVARVLYGTTTPLPGTFEYVVDALANTVTYPAGYPVQPGVDYAVEARTGTLTYLTVWDPAAPGRLDYTWQLEVTREQHTYRGAFAVTTSYAAGDVVRQASRYYVAKAAFTSGGAFVANDWVEYAGPFDADTAFTLRELALWAPDARIDRDTLFTNFGYLFGYRKPSSEAYRAFLKGVSQLFLRGPTLERFESALNVVAGLPVVRDDGEVLTAYDAGYVAVSTLPDPTAGDGGHLFETAYGRDGVLDATAGTFASPTAGFLPSDVGALIRVKTATGVAEYAVTAVATGGLSATVVPTPPNATDVVWTYDHVQLRRHFRVDSANVTHLFGPDDVGAEIVIDAAAEARNVGAFRIAAVLGPREVVLDTVYGFVDASGLAWRLSRSRAQTVTTSRTSYSFPLRVPMKAAVVDPANLGVLTFSAFDALTRAVEVVDYRSDPTWWHHIEIPRELLSLATEAPGRRVVTPDLIPHVIDALDQAVVNDFGAAPGHDVDGDEGLQRTGALTWLGGPWVRIDFAVNGVPGPRPTDVGQYVTIPAGPFTGDYQILGLSPDNTAVRLDRFPPRVASTLTPPQVFTGALPAILYRRTVAYVLMDKFLKYHAMQVRINTGSALAADFLSEAVDLVRQAKPSHVFAYIEPGTSFVDTMVLTESLLLTWGPEYADIVRLVDNDFYGDTPAFTGDFHRTSSDSVSGVGPGGAAVLTLSPTLPYAPDYVRYAYGRFTAGTSGGAPLDEGINYTFDRTTGVVTIPNLDAAAYTFHYVVVAFRWHADADPWWSTGATGGETPSCIHGPDATILAPPAGVLGPGDYALVDRPVEITIT